jgi:alpha-1,4-digalacturonate transport system permease protein
VSGAGRRRPRLIPYLFIAPNLAVFLVFTIYPAVNGFNISFYDSANGRTFTPVGTGNYQEIFTDDEFWGVVRQTVVFVVSFATATMLLATALALLLNAQRRGRGVLRAAYFLPVLLSPVVVGLIWGWALERRVGLVNTIAQALGLGQPGWLIEPGLAMTCTVLVGVWTHLGFYSLILLSGLQGIDGTVYEAARLDGANTRQQIQSITLPLLSPTLLVVLILSTITGFQAFDFIYTLTGGGPTGTTTLIVQFIYQKAFESPIRYGLASAAGVVLFLTVFSITILNYLAGRRREAV